MHNVCFAISLLFFFHYAQGHIHLFVDSVPTRLAKDKVLLQTVTTLHCATSRKVAGSTPYEVFEIFHSLNPSSRCMALRLTQPVTEMGTRVKAVGEQG